TFAFRKYNMPSKQHAPHLSDVERLPLWIKLKDFLPDQKERRTRILGRQIESQAERELRDYERDRVADNLNLIEKVFTTAAVITYQEIDSLTNPSHYSEDDVVEIFIRANSGGTTLGKSELLFSLLKANWEDAATNMTDLLDKLNRHGLRAFLFLDVAL